MFVYTQEKNRKTVISSIHFFTALQLIKVI